MSDMQKQFEEWAEGGGYDLESLDANYACYVNLDTEIARQAWRASRASLAVELPRGEEDDHYLAVMALGLIMDALDSAGVSYK